VEGVAYAPQFAEVAQQSPEAQQYPFWQWSPAQTASRAQTAPSGSSGAQTPAAWQYSPGPQPASVAQAVHPSSVHGVAIVVRAVALLRLGHAGARHRRRKRSSRRGHVHPFPVGGLPEEVPRRHDPVGAVTGRRRTRDTPRPRQADLHRGSPFSRPEARRRPRPRDRRPGASPPDRRRKPLSCSWKKRTQSGGGGGIAGTTRFSPMGACVEMHRAAPRGVKFRGGSPPAGRPAPAAG
jgi:hypothetical protein